MENSTTTVATQQTSLRITLPNSSNNGSSSSNDQTAQSQLPPHVMSGSPNSASSSSLQVMERIQTMPSPQPPPPGSPFPHGNIPHSLAQSSPLSLPPANQSPQCSSPVSSGIGSSISSASSSTTSVARNNKAATNRVTLNVAGEKFAVDANIFLNYPNTMLGRMFGPSLDYNLTKKNARGEYEIGSFVSEEVFRLILEFYKFGFMRIPSHIQVNQVKGACDYFLIPFNEDTVRASNMAALLHELANEGAHTQFSQFLQGIIRPLMVQLARKGERECHFVVLMNEDLVDWDPEYPPPKYPDQPDVEAALIRDDHLCRFLKYVENRDVAKTVLKDRGLKKIKLGIEGFPTQKEKLKTSTRGRQEVVYNYIQRPFIHFSWEKEEARSRHVDFQCPPVNLSTNLAEAASDTDIDQPQGGVFIMATAGSDDNSAVSDNNSNNNTVTNFSSVISNNNSNSNHYHYNHHHHHGGGGGGVSSSLRLPPPHLSINSSSSSDSSTNNILHNQPHSPPIAAADQDAEDSVTQPDEL